MISYVFLIYLANLDGGLLRKNSNSLQSKVAEYTISKNGTPSTQELRGACRSYAI